MPTSQHLVLTTVVTSVQWRTASPDIARDLRARLHAQAQRRGLALTGPLEEDVQPLPGGTRVRVTARADGEPAAVGGGTSVSPG